MVRLIVLLVISPHLFFLSHVEWNILLLSLWIVTELSLCINTTYVFIPKDELIDSKKKISNKWD